jgi:hypothetical protein
MPIARAGDAIPSDTCRTARNGRCEDGLYFSLFHVNDKTWSDRNEKDTPYTAMCLPNTDLTDCGWRSPPRSVNLGNARSFECKINGMLSRNNGAAARTPLPCYDVSDYFSPPTDRIEGSLSDRVEDRSCGLGTQSEECGSKPIYVTPGAPGGCHDTCNIDGIPNIHPDYKPIFNPLTTCTDGGHGSFRIPFEMPAQRAPSYGTLNSTLYHYQEEWSANGHGAGTIYRWDYTYDLTRGGVLDANYAKLEQHKTYVYYDFACEYGTQARTI